MRMCVGCQTSKPKKELIRIVKCPDGKITLDETLKMNGRGAYVCRNTECVKIAHKGHKLDKAFEMQVEASVYNDLEKQMEILQIKENGGVVNGTD